MQKCFKQVLYDQATTQIQGIESNLRKHTEFGATESWGTRVFAAGWWRCTPRKHSGTAQRAP